MTRAITIQPAYFKDYRVQFGFTNQTLLKDFLAAKDISPLVDYKYIEKLNKRLCEIIKKVNLVVSSEIRIKDIEEFCDKNISGVYNKIKDNGILPQLNNQGRRPEQVFFSWIRGYIISAYFLDSIGDIFGVDTKKIKLIGEDDINSLETFKRAPTADLEVNRRGEKIRIEMQSGFQGINDIKQHKVLEAKRMFDKDKTMTLAIHFDIFNGQVAFVRLDQIKGNDINWITRQQMEGQTVFNIDQNYFVWKLTEKPPRYEDIQF